MKIEVYSDQQYTVLKIDGVEYRAAWANEKIAIENAAKIAEQFMATTYDGPRGDELEVEVSDG